MICGLHGEIVERSFQLVSAEADFSAPAPGSICSRSAVTIWNFEGGEGLADLSERADSHPSFHILASIVVGPDVERFTRSPDWGLAQ
jgi:hypothetical protein